MLTWTCKFTRIKLGTKALLEEKKNSRDATRFCCAWVVEYQKRPSTNYGRTCSWIIQAGAIALKLSGEKRHVRLWIAENMTSNQVKYTSKTHKADRDADACQT